MHLVLFFTYGVSLKTWEEAGTLEREIALYLRLIDNGVDVSFVTYGHEDKVNYGDVLTDINILDNKHRFPQGVYARLIPILHGKVLRNATIFKTNQIKGGQFARFASVVLRKPLLIRAGYLWSQLLDNAPDSPLSKRQSQHLRVIERALFNDNHTVVITTDRLRRYIVEHYKASPDLVHVIPNFVLIDQFAPSKAPHNRKPVILYVGRLSPEKNLSELMNALSGLDVELRIIGSGPEKSHLEKLAQENHIDLRFLGRIPNLQLPMHYNAADLFVLPSYSEGHPKTLLEAMSCGRPVIGSAVPGIQEVIEHESTGYLCQTDADSIRGAIETLLADDDLRERIGRSARTYIVDNFSLDEIVHKEIAVLEKAIQRKKS